MAHTMTVATPTARGARFASTWPVSGTGALVPVESWELAGRPQERWAEVVTLPLERSHSAAVTQPVSRTRTVLTRRGRLLRTLTVLFVLALVGLALAARAMGAPGVSYSHTAVVGSETSLVEVARSQLPQVPVREAVVILQGYNDLGDTSVRPGQRIRVPQV